MTSTTVSNLYVDLAEPETLAQSLEATVSYLKGCAAKQGEPESSYRGIKICQSLALNLREANATSPQFRSYVNAMRELDSERIESFDCLRFDYQARLGSAFHAPTVQHYLSDLSLIAFTLSSMESGEVSAQTGSGLTPRRRAKASAT